MAQRLGKWLHKRFGYPWVTALEAVTLVPGDLLIVHLSADVTRTQAMTMREDLSRRLPPGVNCCMMLGDETRLDVVRVVDPASRPMQRPIGG